MNIYTTQRTFLLLISFFFIKTALFSQTIPLSSFWTKQGSGQTPLIVKSMSTGDVNGDGLLDFVAQANLLSLGNRQSFFSATTNDWLISPTYTSHNRQGYLGDHNGDGKKDVVEILNNQIAVFNGSNSGLPSNPTQLYNLPNCNGCGLDFSFDGNGDINNDGYDDLVVGAPFTNSFLGHRGSVFVFYGSSTGLNFNNRDSIGRPYIGTYFGNQVRFAGDVNKDGFDDILVASQTYNGEDFDELVYIIYGKTGALGEPLSIGLGGRNAEEYAHEIGAAGDINGDGFADFYISAASRYVRSPLMKGKVEIVYGKSSPSLGGNIVELEPPSNATEGVFGKSVCNAGDFNDDGFSDLAVTFNDKVLIYAGSAQGLSTAPRYEFLACCQSTVRFAGDIDKDGFSDLLVGEQETNFGAGKAQLLRGRPSMIPNFGVQEREICTQSPIAIFQDSSIEAISRVWDFGDGTQSVAQNPQHSYTRTGFFTVKLTTKDARGHVWSITKDSFIIVRAPIEGGAYTVGEGGNFSDINQINNICKCGISGNVNLKFKNGIYAPPTLRLENVDTKGFTLTFESESGNRDSVLFGPLWRFPYSLTAAPNIIIKNTKNVTFKKIYIERANGYNEPSINLSNSENIKFDNCIFPTANIDTNIFARNVKNLRFDSCIFSHGFPILHALNCDGVTINKSYRKLIPDDLTVENVGGIFIDSSKNFLASQSYFLYHQIINSENIKIEKSHDTQVSIEGSRKTEISQNEDNFSLSMKNSVGFKIHKNRHSTRGGYGLTNTIGLDTEGYNLIANNFIGFPKNSTTYSSGGISILEGRNMRIYHNSIIFESFQGESCKGVNLRVQNSDSVDVRNNLFLQVPDTECAFAQIDNNQRYTANFNAYCNNRFFNIDIWNSHSLLGFSEFKAAIGQDQNSILGTMKMDSGLLTPLPETGGLINAAAPYLGQVPDDIDGKLRTQSGVDIGALEFDFANYRDFSLDTIQNQVLNIGTNILSVRFTNRSSLRADSCRLAYQVNNGAVVHEKWVGNLAAYAPLIYNFSTPLSILKGKAYTLKIWIENTNESTRQNDSLVRVFGVPMLGNYTINGNNADFNSLTDFYKNLEIAGTQNDVVGLLSAGNYEHLDENIQFSFILPAKENQKHWVTLKGEGNDPDKVHLTYNFLQQPYLRFENMTLEVLPHPNLLDLNGTFHYAFKVEIKDCIIQSHKNIDNKVYDFNINADTSIIIQNTQFKNLDNALKIYLPQDNNDKKVLVENCRFSNVGTAIHSQNFNIPNFSIIKNIIDTANVGLYLIGTGIDNIDTNRAIISQNRIIHCKDKGIAAAAIYKCVIANNFIQAHGFSMDITTPNSCKIINNSCFGTFKLNQNDFASHILNNSFVAQDTPMVGLLYQRETYFHHSNFNNYYSLNNKPFKIFFLNDNDRLMELSLAEFKQFFKTDANSISANPRYESQTDMHIDTISPLNGAGGGIFFNVTTDIDGQDRDLIKNDIGADEIKTPSVVMPGDANFDGIVDMYDLVSVGVALPQQLQGTPRSNPSIDWLPQTSANWSSEILGKNAKHVDTNGDGIININDTLAISRNYNKIHNYHLRNRSAGPALFFSNLPTTVTEGNWVTADIKLGTNTEKATDVYGLLFSIKYDTSKIKKGSLSLSFDTCWIAQANQRLSMTKDVGRIDIGIVRTTGSNISGSGLIAKLRFQVKDSILGKAQITLSEGVLINNIGAKQDLVVKNDSLIVQLKISPTINVLFGSSQITPVNKPFIAPLKVQIKDAAGKSLPNLLVKFTLPSGNIPSATFKDGSKYMTSLTNTEGVAQSLDMIANGIVGSYNVVVMLEDSTNTKILLANSATTALVDIDKPMLTIFPNPFKDIINLQKTSANNDNCYWSLYDLLGKQLLKGIFSNESSEIDLSPYNSGIYVVKYTMNGKT